jgi:SPP1 gp7 family putative phage head morphogenesis protein
MVIRENKGAAEYIQGKGAISPEGFGRLPPEIRARAVCVAHVGNMDALRDLIKKIATLPQGADWRKLRREIAQDITPFMSGNETAARKKAELLLRTHGFQAYASGRYEQQREAKAAVPYWMYLTVGDANVRDEHAALDGKVLPADDPFWQGHYPPWDFGCRCVVAGVTAGQADEIRREDAGKPAPQRRLLEGKALEDARAGRVAVDGRGRADVRTPVERKGGGGYAWTPGRIAPTLAELESRYTPEEWRLVEQTLRRERITGPDGKEVSVLEFIRSLEK